MSEPRPDPELAQVELALAGLKPTAALDRDRLMFRAGQASLPRRAWLWPTATAALLVLSVTLGGMLLNRPAPEVVFRVVSVPVAVPQPLPPAPPPSVEPSLPAAKAHTVSSPLEYAQMRKEVQRWGVEALSSRPPMVAVSWPPSTVGSLLHEMEQ